MGALLEQFRAAGIVFVALPDGNLRAQGALTDPVRASIRVHKAAILVELAANDCATPEQATELRALVALVAASWPQAERAEALAVALADPADALTCWRALAEDHAEQYARARVVGHTGPYTSAPLSERDPDDDRRTCMDCANLTAREHRCLAAWRGERPGNAAHNYRPVNNLLGRCECYRPKPTEPDQRGGAERWPFMVENTKRLQEIVRNG